MVLATICLLFFALALAGMPLVWALLATTAGTIWILDRFYPLKAVFLTYINGVEPLHLAAVPLFILAGELISHGGVGRRLIELAKLLLGFLPGGMGVVTVSSCTMFGAISGSAIADSAAVGSVMLPGMARRGYPPPYSAALVATAGTLGILIPPSIPLLVFGFVGNVSIAELFISGIVPGLLFASCLIALCVWKGRRGDFDRGGERPDWGEIAPAFVECLPALAMPVIVLGGIYSGIFTPTESASIAVAYGLIVSMFVYREIELRDLPQIILRCFVTSATVMLVVGATSSLAWLITIEQVPLHLAQAIQGVAADKFTFLLLLNIMLLVVGIFIEPLPALILTAPLFIPTATAFGIDPVHLGIVMTFNLAIGLYTPPVGGTLFVAAKLSGARMGEISRALLPMLGIAIAVLLTITYVEAVPMWLVWLVRS